MSIAKAAAMLEAGDWQAAHAIAQDDESALGCWAHGIVHVLEGDLDNARYWYRRAGRPFRGAERIADDIAELKAAAAANAGKD
jgi:hypothetical protein